MIKIRDPISTKVRNLSCQTYVNIVHDGGKLLVGGVELVDSAHGGVEVLDVLCVHNQERTVE